MLSTINPIPGLSRAPGVGRPYIFIGYGFIRRTACVSPRVHFRPHDVAYIMIDDNRPDNSQENFRVADVGGKKDDTEGQDENRLGAFALSRNALSDKCEYRLR